MSRYEIDQTAGERQLLAILASGDRSSDIARITAPTLVIHGEDDPLLPLAAGKEVADLIPKSEFLALPRMGHDLPPIHFETITRAIASHVWQAEAYIRLLPWQLVLLPDASYESCDECAVS